MKARDRSDGSNISASRPFKNVLLFHPNPQSNNNGFYSRASFIEARFTVSVTAISVKSSIFILIKHHQYIYFWKAQVILNMNMYFVFVSDSAFC